MRDGKPTRMVVLMLVGWLGHLAGAAWRALEVLSEGRLMDGMNKLTVHGQQQPLQHHQARFLKRFD